MKVSFFSLILIFICTIIFFVGKSLKQIFMWILILTLFVTLNIRMGYFVSINDKEISYSFILMLFLFILSLFLINKKRISLKYITLITVFIFTAIISSVLLCEYPYKDKIITASLSWDNYIKGWIKKSHLEVSETGWIGYLLQLIEYSFILLAVKYNFSRGEIILIFKKVLNLSKISVIIGIIEFIFKNIFKSNIMIKIWLWIFGVSEATHDYLDYSGRFIAVQGFTKEKSMFAFTLFCIIFMLFIELKLLYINKASKLVKRKNYIWIICTSGLLLNGSLSGFVYIAILAVIFFILHFNKKNIGNIGILGFLSGIVIFIVTFIILNLEIYVDWINSSSAILRRFGMVFLTIQNLLNNKQMIVSSEAIRFSSIVDTIKIIFQRPLFGIGLGATHCTSGFFTFLSAIGWFGIINWISMVVNGFLETKKEYPHFKSLSIFVLIIPHIILNELYSILLVFMPFILLVLKYVLIQDFDLNSESSIENIT